MGFADFDPNVPTRLGWTYSYNANAGGSLTVNGKPVEYSEVPRLLTVGPFGDFVELKLTPEEEALVLSQETERIWKEIVLSHLYQRTGDESDRGTQLDGVREYRSSDGTLAYRGTFSKGKRDGTWTYYYREGGVRAVLVYQDERRHGNWKYFAKDGSLKATQAWNQGNPVGKAVQQVTPWGSTVLNPDGSSQTQTR